ncbi:MAG: hypothetical protein UT84_C0058G0004 [Candidatus Curtissbacteria bacterium GW2011_GWA1_40_16]|uniref:Uncharacterized protein n=1 Tax=Candidatus Curtissbacteria bacterium GW2011_GWA1_40_16 TaxID=1618405 RepID=A0A0G0UC31_9BACT|nr:MAG: hypothetical protein UT84_C0058G0004 [Candidatus Curtissbacteria bacterium GW2011_GWA1_40_16]
MGNTEKEHSSYDIKDLEVYSQELPLRALKILKGVVNEHPATRAIMMTACGESVQGLAGARCLSEFGLALQVIFGEETTDILEVVKEDLGDLTNSHFLRILHGRYGMRLSEIYREHPEIVLEVNDMRITAINLIKGVQGLLEMSDSSPVLISGQSY